MQKNDDKQPDVMISIGPVHLRRVTAWGVHCSQHGMVREKSGHTKEAALANAQAHVKKGHIGSVAVRISKPR